MLILLLVMHSPWKAGQQAVVKCTIVSPVQSGLGVDIATGCDHTKSFHHLLLASDDFKIPDQHAHCELHPHA